MLDKSNKYSDIVKNINLYDNDDENEKSPINRDTEVKKSRLKPFKVYNGKSIK